MSTNTDYYDVPAGQRHLDEVEYMHGVSAPLVAELELSPAMLTGRAVVPARAGAHDRSG